MSDTTQWRSVWLLFFCGCTLSLHIGKLPPALPLLSEAFSLRLSEAGNLVSMFSFLIALTGLLFGVLVARLGYVSFAIVGVALSGIASVVGATTDSLLVLNVSRAFEGLGWIVAVIAIPALMVRLSKSTDVPVVLGIWGGFLPAGAGTMMLIAPYLQALDGWRLSWWLAGGASLIASLIVLEIGRRNQSSFAALKHNRVAKPLQEIKSGRSKGLFFCFLFYSFSYVALTAFLPTVLSTDSDTSIELASTLTALVMFANVAGNMLAGRLLRYGVVRYKLLVFAATLMGITGLITLLALPLPIRVISAIAFSVSGGLIPGTLFSTASLLASSPAATGILFGLMLQAAGVGQWLGPILFTRVVEASGFWWAGGLLLLLVGLVGALIALFNFKTLKH